MEIHSLRKLQGNEKEWIFFNGEQRVMYDFIPENRIPMDFTTDDHLKTMEEWSIENKYILDYDVRYTPIPGNIYQGIYNYEHIFTALRPGRTFVLCGRTKRKIPVFVQERPMISYFNFFNSTIIRGRLLRM